MTATDLAITDHLDLLPRPAELEHRDGRFVVDAETVIRANRDGEHAARALAAALEPACGFRLRIGSLADAAPAKRIDLRLGVIAGGDEAYELTITANGVEAVANEPAGLVLASQTMRQLLPAAALGGALVGDPWSLPCLRIRDQPAFAWRGLMLDLARHFMPVSYLERMIDLLALYKMNRLHLHLTDGQAWTMEIAAYPRLTQANRPAPVGQPARGTYTQRELRGLVAYAAERNVVLVPEIEFPCHSDAALDAYPELLCVNHPARVGGPMDHKEYCAGRDDVLDFVRTVLREVAGVFPSPWIHIGGDEYYGTAWERCPDCQRRLRDERLEDEDTPELRALFANAQGSPRKHLLYRSFMRRIAAAVVGLGRTPILWDDLAWRGTFPPGSALLQWHYRGLFDWMQKAFTPEDPAADAARSGHPAIAAPASHLYFDYFHGAALLPRLYAFDPFPAELEPARAPLILGPHACLWEHAQSDIERMAFPRLLALAEVGWTPKANRRWEDFAPRLERHYPRLDALSVDYARPRDADALRRTGLVADWDFPALSGFFREWFSNEIVTGDGAYEVTLRLETGHQTAAFTLWWTADGRDVALEPRPARTGEPPGLRVYPVTVSDYRDAILYSLRASARGDGSPCRGGLALKRLT